MVAEVCWADHQVARSLGGYEPVAVDCGRAGCCISPLSGRQVGRRAIDGLPLTCSGIIACVTQSEHVLRMADLRRACSVLLDEAERRFGDEVNLSELPVDYYWTLDLAAAFDMSQTPAEFGCGQVGDDAAEIGALARRAPGDVVALWHDLDHVASALRLLAHLDLPR
ncbi:hypothetical protein OID55_17560 [Streptomyces sp. NBC_00715]|uniref:hypothetical protein n=1 Tax=Streptomyces sp. NBC_00715 TaxID=2975811 RepID=UPI0038634211